MIIKLMQALIPPATNTKHRALILAATKLFHRYGFSKVSVEELCRYADVSKVTFYRYFKGKDELILHIMTLLMEDAIQRTKAVLDGDLSLKQKFDQVIVMKQELMSAIGEEIIQGLFSYPALHEYYLSLVQESYKQLRDFLLLEQEQGRINQGLNIDIFMVVIREIAAFLSRESLNRSGSKFKELVAQVNEILVYGIFSRELK